MAGTNLTMKITTVIARLLLGFIFLIFGLNGFFHFIPMPPPSGVAGQFLGALFVSRYFVVVFLLQLIPAVLLLINRYVPPRPRPARSHYREHLTVSHSNGPERSASSSRRDGAVERCFPKRSFRFRWSLATARSGAGAAATKSRSRFQKPARRNLCLRSQSLLEARAAGRNGETVATNEWRRPLLSRIARTFPAGENRSFSAAMPIEIGFGSVVRGS
jgi:hypothetical protein